MNSIRRSLEVAHVGPGVRLWRPSADALHDPDIVPQDPPSTDVLLGLPYGECGGVQMANQVIEKLGELAQGAVYGNHAPTHGADATAGFIRLGARFAVEPEAIPLGMPYVISAHGASPDVRRRAEEHGLQAYDVTCPLVYRTHRAILEAAAGGNSRVAYISFGSLDHPERLGAAGVAREAGVLFTAIASPAEAEQLAADADPDGSIVIVGQTTNNSDEADRVAAALQERAALRGIPVIRANKQDVCHTVRDRQNSTREIVRRGVGALVVVGSVNSKNTASLAGVATQEAQACRTPLDIYLTNSWHQLPVLQGRIGVVSGASTRRQNVEAVLIRLAPSQGVTPVGEDTDKGIVFAPVHPATQRLLEDG
jgi:4-hydroxy-3-methylbut-2-enyl diphosphate reductase